jgi:hypothetical protein
MSRYETQSPSWVERILAGCLFALAAVLLYAVWGFFHHHRVAFLDHDSVLKYLAGGAFVVGFLLGISRTAALVFRSAPLSTQPLASLPRRLLYAVVLVGAVWLVMEVL